MEPKVQQEPETSVLPGVTAELEAKLVALEARIAELEAAIEGRVHNLEALLKGIIDKYFGTHL